MHSNFDGIKTENSFNHSILMSLKAMAGQRFCETPKRGCILKSRPRVLDVAHC